MTLPANGATISGVVLLSALADGSGIAGLQFLVNGGNVGSEITSGACSAEWDTTRATDGTYVLTALVRDELGNLMPSAPVVVNVTNAAPEISSVAAQVASDTSAMITWITGQTSTSQVEYGPTSSYGSVSTVNEALVSNHSVLLTGLAPNTLYHFRVHSLNWLGTLSSSGDFILATGSGSGGCVTPDPFAALGGGTCWNGGWLPPGITPPGGAPAPAPPPVLGPVPFLGPPVPAQQENSICGAPDPFAGIGGGACWNGGWLPPGMAPPATNPGAYTAPLLGPQPVQSAPVLGPALGNASCLTPDPFSVLGGGTCWNGGWYAPGTQLPTASGGTNSAPVLGPAIQSVPTANASCLGADPFSSLPGFRGRCVNGGWILVPIDKF